MGGLLTKCKCTFTSEPAEAHINQTENFTNQNDALEDEKYESQSTLKSENTQKDFYSISLAESLDRLDNFRHQELFVDFSIKVDGEHFSAHKNVLAASCAFFKDLFNASEEICYEMANVEPNTIEEVLNFLYTGKCRLNQQNAGEVLCVARLLGIQDLQEASIRYLSSAEYDTTVTEDEFFTSQERFTLTSIREFQVEGLFCDITLTTSCGKVIPVHKNILAAVSCYFQGLFRLDMKEIHENNVDLGVIDESVVSELLQFIYCGQIRITFGNVESLLQTSDYLLIESLKTEIEKVLKASLTLSNFWQLFALVKCCDGFKEVLSDLSQLGCNNFGEISKSDEFLEITEQDMKFFLSNDDSLSSETQMFEYLIHWYNLSRQQRQESFKNLLHFIHMCSIPDQYLRFLAESEGIDDLLSYTGHQLKAEVPLDDLKRTARFYNLAVLGISTNHNFSGNFVCYWLPFAGPWSFITSIQHPTDFARSSPLVFSGDALFLHSYSYDRVKLFFVSNPLSSRYFNRSDVYRQPHTNTDDVSVATEDSVTIALSNYVYFIGGKLGDETLSTVQRYNMKTESWECVSSMQERRYEHFAVSYKDRYIYVFGGVNRMR